MKVINKILGLVMLCLIIISITSSFVFANENVYLVWHENINDINEKNLVNSIINHLNDDEFENEANDVFCVNDGEYSFAIKKLNLNGIETFGTEYPLTNQYKEKCSGLLKNIEGSETDGTNSNEKVMKDNLRISLIYNKDAILNYNPKVYLNHVKFCKGEKADTNVEDDYKEEFNEFSPAWNENDGANNEDIDKCLNQEYYFRANNEKIKVKQTWDYNGPSQNQVCGDGSAIQIYYELKSKGYFNLITSKSPLKLIEEEKNGWYNRWCENGIPKNQNEGDNKLNGQITIRDYCRIMGRYDGDYGIIESVDGSSESDDKYLCLHDIKTSNRKGDFLNNIKPNFKSKTKWIWWYATYDYIIHTINFDIDYNQEKPKYKKYSEGFENNYDYVSSGQNWKVCNAYNKSDLNERFNEKSILYNFESINPDEIEIERICQSPSNFKSIKITNDGEIYCDNNYMKLKPENDGECNYYNYDNDLSENTKLGDKLKEKYEEMCLNGKNCLGVMYTYNNKKIKLSEDDIPKEDCIIFYDGINDEFYQYTKLTDAELDKVNEETNTISKDSIESFTGIIPEESICAVDEDNNLINNNGKTKICTENQICNGFIYNVNVGQGKTCCYNERGAECIDKNNENNNDLIRKECQGEYNGKKAFLLPKGNLNDDSPFKCILEVPTEVKSDDFVCCAEYTYNPNYNEKISAKSQSYICYQDGVQSKIGECCYGQFCNNIKLGDKSENNYIDDNLFSQGVSTNTLYSFDKKKTQDNIYFLIDKIGVYDKKEPTIYSDDDRQFVINPKDNVYLEFDFAYLKDKGYTEPEFVKIKYLNLSQDYSKIYEKYTDNVFYKQYDLKNHTVKILKKDQTILKPNMWHHIVINISSNEMKLIKEINILSSDNKNIKIYVDNIRLKYYDNDKFMGGLNILKQSNEYKMYEDAEISNLDLINEKNEKASRYCTGPFLKWVSSLEPVYRKDYNNANDFLKYYGPYQYACESNLGFDWTGTRCCGSRTGFKEGGEFYADRDAGCWNSNYIYNDETVLESVREKSPFEAENRYFDDFADIKYMISQENEGLLSEGKFYDCIGNQGTNLNKINDLDFGNIKNFKDNSDTETGRDNTKIVDACSIVGSHYCSKNSGEWNYLLNTEDLNKAPRIKDLYSGDIIIDDNGNYNYETLDTKSIPKVFKNLNEFGYNTNINGNVVKQNLKFNVDYSTDENCGGPFLESCNIGKKCNFNADCKSGSCYNHKCIENTCSNGIKDIFETDIDCGGICVKENSDEGKCTSIENADGTITKKYGVTQNDCKYGLNINDCLEDGRCACNIGYNIKKSTTKFETISYDGISNENDAEYKLNNLQTQNNNINNQILTTSNVVRDIIVEDDSVNNDDIENVKTNLAVYNAMNEGLNVLSDEGCCPTDYCWNGFSCVASEDYMSNSQKKPLFLGESKFLKSEKKGGKLSHVSKDNNIFTAGYRCIIPNKNDNENIVKNAEWKVQELKYDWYGYNNGYCGENQCYAGIQYSKEPIEINDCESIRKIATKCNDITNLADECFEDINGEKVKKDFNKEYGECISKNTKLLKNAVKICDENNKCNYYNITHNGCVDNGFITNGLFSTDVDLNGNIIGYNQPGDLICSNGHWKSNLGYIALNLKKYAEDNENKYDLFCTNDNRNLNYNENIKKNVPSCVLNTKNKVIVGIPLNIKNENPTDEDISENIKDTITSYNGFKCEQIGPVEIKDQEKYNKAYTFNCEYGFDSSDIKLENIKYYAQYDDFSKTVLISNKPLNLDSFISNFLISVKKFFNRIIGKSEPNFRIDTSDALMNKVFISKENNALVEGIEEIKYNEKRGKLSSYLYVNYENIALDNKRNVNLSNGVIDHFKLFEYNIVKNGNIEFTKNKTDKKWSIAAEVPINIEMNKLYNNRDNYINNINSKFKYLFNGIRLKSKNKNNYYICPEGVDKSECNLYGGDPFNVIDKNKNNAQKMGFDCRYNASDYRCKEYKKILNKFNLNNVDNGNGVDESWCDCLDNDGDGLVDEGCSIKLKNNNGDELNLCNKYVLINNKLVETKVISNHHKFCSNINEHPCKDNNKPELRTMFVNYYNGAYDNSQTENNDYENYYVYSNIDNVNLNINQGNNQISGINNNLEIVDYENNNDNSIYNTNNNLEGVNQFNQLNNDNDFTNLNENTNTDTSDDNTNNEMNSRNSFDDRNDGNNNNNETDDSNTMNEKKDSTDKNLNSKY